MLRYRQYENYQAYVHDQGEKQRMFAEQLLLQNERRTKSFYKEFASYKQHMLPGKALCLGARTGCEVKAAIEHGFSESIGLDLHPLGELVIEGDWHNIPFPDGSFENVYTNSLDHCFDLQRLAAEICRVLTRKGVFIFKTHTEYALSDKERNDMRGMMAAHHRNALFWDSIDDVMREFTTIGFSIVSAKIFGKGKYQFSILRK